MMWFKLWYRFIALLKKGIYKLAFGSRIRFGRKTTFRSGFHAACEEGGRIEIGDRCFFNHACSLSALYGIRIGHDTIFGENVKVYDHNHRFRDSQKTIKEQGYTAAPIVIGANCWIGSNVTVLKGAWIGKGCVIGAGCVVKEKIPPYTILSADGMQRLRENAPEISASKPVRVLVLDTVMDRGGAETMIMNYMRHIDPARVCFDFMVNREYRAAYEDEIESLGGTIYRMCPMYPQYFVRYKREIRTFLKEHPEYRVIHSNLEERSYFALKEAKRLGVPVRISHSHNVPRGFGLKTVFRWYFRMRLPRYNTHLFTCGEEAGDWLYGKKNRRRFIMMNNAVDARQYTYDPVRAADVRKEWNISEDALVIGHVGRFFPQKNHTFLLDIFAEIHKIRPDSVLLLVGGGEQDDALKNKMREKAEELGLGGSVRFLGVRDDVARLLQAFNLFLLPSLYEGFPVTMVEAQAAGLPCVISDGVPPQCDLTGNVTIVPLSASPEEWARRTLHAADGFNRTDTYEKIAAAGFDICQNAGWLTGFYESALADAEQLEE